MPTVLQESVILQDIGYPLVVRTGLEAAKELVSRVSSPSTIYLPVGGVGEVRLISVVIGRNFLLEFVVPNTVRSGWCFDEALRFRRRRDGNGDDSSDDGDWGEQNTTPWISMVA